MRDQPPMRASTERWAECISRFSQTFHARQRTGILDVEIASFPSERQLARQVAVGAGRMRRYRFDSGSLWVESQIDQRQIDLSAWIVSSLRGPSRRIPVAAFLLTIPGMAEGVKRLKRADRIQVWGIRGHRID